MAQYFLSLIDLEKRRVENKQQQIDILTMLIEQCNRCYLEYCKLEEQSNFDDLEMILNVLAHQKRSFAKELNEEVLFLGGKKILDNSEPKPLSKKKTKTNIISESKFEELLELVLNREKHLARLYAKNITDQSLPSYLREKLIKQHSLIKSDPFLAESFKNVA